VGPIYLPKKKGGGGVGGGGGWGGGGGVGGGGWVVGGLLGGGGGWGGGVGMGGAWYSTVLWGRVGPEGRPGKCFKNQEGNEHDRRTNRVTAFIKDQSSVGGRRKGNPAWKISIAKEGNTKSGLRNKSILKKSCKALIVTSISLERGATLAEGGGSCLGNATRKETPRCLGGWGRRVYRRTGIGR